MDIRIIAPQIHEVFMPTQLVEGKDRLDAFFLSYGYLEGKPIIEPLKNGKYKLITYCENYYYYKSTQPFFPFNCTVMYFDNDNERYIELLKQLHLGKARSNFSEKYIIVNKLLETFKIDQLSEKTKIPTKTLKKLTFSEDKYKPFLEYSLKIDKRSVIESIIRMLKSSIQFKQRTEDFLLYQALSSEPYIKLTSDSVKNINSVLIIIEHKFNLLSEEGQITIIMEITQLGMKILSRHFIDRCDELLWVNPSYQNEFAHPTIQ